MPGDPGLGAQAFGRVGVDKADRRISYRLAGADDPHRSRRAGPRLCPPYSSANDPVNLAAFVAQNAVSGFSPLLIAAALRAELASARPPPLIDVRSAEEWRGGHLRGARHLELNDLRGRAGELNRDRRIAVYWRSGSRAHPALRILKGLGLEDVVNVTGGVLGLEAEGGFEWEKA